MQTDDRSALLQITRQLQLENTVGDKVFVSILITTYDIWEFKESFNKTWIGLDRIKPLNLNSSSGLCSSRARWPLVPNFCSWATRKSQIFHTNHMLGQVQSTGHPLIFLRAQPCSYNHEKVLNFISPLEKFLNSGYVLEKYLISLFGLEKSLKFSTLSTPDNFFYNIGLFCQGKLGSSAVYKNLWNSRVA